MLRSVALGATAGRASHALDAMHHLLQHGWARPSAVGTARFRAERLEATGEGFADGSVDSLGYRLCLLDAIRIGIRRRDLFASPSLRYADPRIGLLAGPAWEAARPSICRTLGSLNRCDRPKLQAFDRAVGRSLSGAPRPTCPRTRLCRSTAPSWSFPPSTNWKSRPPWSRLKPPIAARLPLSGPTRTAAGSACPHRFCGRLHSRQRGRRPGRRCCHQHLRPCC